MRCIVPEEMQTNARRRRFGFTLIELLIVMAIIGVLIGLVFVAIGGVSDSARRADSANALRSMMRAYATYSGDNRQALLPGYLDPADFTTGVSPNPGQMRFDVDDLEGNTLSPADAAPYVWRLMPYLDDEWEALIVDYGSDAIVSRIEFEIRNDELGPGTVEPASDIGIGLRPAFGLNSIYLGGDALHGGPDAAMYSPWNTAGNPTIAATRTSEVRNPADLIVFGPSANRNDSLADDDLHRFDVDFGYVELRPPYIFNPGSDSFSDPHWSVNKELKAVINDTSFFNDGGGVPIARWSDKTLPTGRFDGSVSMDEMSDIGPPQGMGGGDQAKREFMRYWWPFATGYRGSQIQP